MWLAGGLCGRVLKLWRTEVTYLSCVCWGWKADSFREARSWTYLLSTWSVSSYSELGHMLHGVFFFFKIYLNYSYLLTCTCVCLCMRRSGSFRSGAAVTGSCELSDVGTELMSCARTMCVLDRWAISPDPVYSQDGIVKDHSVSGPIIRVQRSSPVLQQCHQ